MESTYSKVEVCKISRASIRQLQWVHERQVIVPEMVGHKHIYSQQQVLTTCLLFELKRRKAFLRFARARVIVRYLEKHVNDWLMDRTPGTYLVYEMKNRQIMTSSDEFEVITRLAGASSGCHLISIDYWIERIDDDRPKTRR